MAKIICIAAPMAGSGRTTAAVNLAASFAALELDTLLMDCDPLNRCLSAAVIDPPADAPGLSQILSAKAEPEACCFSTRLAHLKILPAGQNLWQTIANPELMPLNPVGFEKLTGLDKSSWDIIVLDSSAIFSPMVQWAAYVSDVLIIIVRLDAQSADFVEDILRSSRCMIKNIIEFSPRNSTIPKTAKIVINGCDDLRQAEALLGPELFDQLSPYFMPTCIPDDQRLHEATVFGKPAICHDIKSPGAMAFLKLGRSLAEILEKPLAKTQG
jgi:chromosome partitioning protein